DHVELPHQLDGRLRSIRLAVFVPRMGMDDAPPQRYSPFSLFYKLYSRRRCPLGDALRASEACGDVRGSFAAMERHDRCISFVRPATIDRIRWRNHRNRFTPFYYVDACHRPRSSCHLRTGEKFLRVDCIGSEYFFRTVEGTAGHSCGGEREAEGDDRSEAT